MYRTNGQETTVTVRGEWETRTWEQKQGLSKEEDTNRSYIHAWY